MRLLAAITGALLAWILHAYAGALLDSALGAFAGYVVAELIGLRQRIEQLERQRRRMDTLEGAQGPGPGPGWKPEVPPPAGTAGPAGTAHEAPSDAAAGAVWLPHGPEVSPAFARLITRWISEYFTGGNTLVRVGILILFFGVAFLLRYIALHAQLPLALQLAAVAAGGAALLVLGWRLRRRRPGYALTLQGGGMGVLYLTTFAALHVYALLQPATTFALLVALAVLSAALAVVQESRAFAVVAITGGFLAPLVASVGQEQPVILFSYYLVLNGSVLAIALYRSWRELNWVAFLFTFVIATAWGVLRYRTALFASTEPFLVLFFLFYLAIALLSAFRQPPQRRGHVDTPMVFGAPIAAFGDQAALLHDRSLALAGSALAVAALYFLLSWVLERRFRATHRPLAEAFFVLGVVFFTVAVPLGMHGSASAVTWALEGAALIFIGCRQLRAVSRAMGVLLIVGSGILFGWRPHPDEGSWLVLNGFFLGGMVVSLAAVFGATTLQRHADRLLPHERALPALMFLWGLGWWLYAGQQEIELRVPPPYGQSAALVFLTGTALAASELYRRTSLAPARVAALCLLPVLGGFAVLTRFALSHPLADGGWLAWPLGFAVLYVICRRHEGEPGEPLARVLHTGSAWLLTVLLGWELVFQLDPLTAGQAAWRAITWMLVPAVLLAALPWLLRRIAWPLQRHEATYRQAVGGGLAAYLAGWTVWSLLHLPGDSSAWAYVPVANATDLPEVAVLGVLAGFWGEARAARQGGAGGRPARVRSLAAADDRAVEGLTGIAVVALTLLWLNAALLRCLHVWTGIPYEAGAMLRSMTVQTVLSIFWTVLALTAMLIATWRRARMLWLGGAALLTLVVIKLFVIDLSHIGTLERVVSFLGVGVLTLVIGYFSPLPPPQGKASGHEAS